MGRNRLQSHLLQTLVQLQVEAAGRSLRHLPPSPPPTGTLLTCKDCLSPFQLRPGEPPRIRCKRCRGL
jgi:hypothetical protein